MADLWSGIYVAFWINAGISGMFTGRVKPVFVSMHVTFPITCMATALDPSLTSCLRLTVNIEILCFNEKNLFVSLFSQMEFLRKNKTTIRKRALFPLAPLGLHLDLVTSEGGDRATTRTAICLHKGVRVPNETVRPALL